MRNLLLSLALLSTPTGCAGLPRALDHVQAGLAQADRATEDAAHAFLQAVSVVQAACATAPDPASCMDKAGLGPEALDSVCVLGPDERTCVGGSVADLAAAYRTTAAGAQAAAQAWGELAPHLEAAQAAAEAVRSGVAK